MSHNVSSHEATPTGGPEGSSRDPRPARRPRPRAVIIAGEPGSAGDDTGVENPLLPDTTEATDKAEDVKDKAEDVKDKVEEVKDEPKPA
jgi:hypothetical protein